MNATKCRSGYTNCDENKEGYELTAQNRDTYLSASRGTGYHRPIRSVLYGCGLLALASIRDTLRNFLIALTGQPVTMSSGMKLQPDYAFEDCPLPLDSLVIPSAKDIERLMDDPVLLEWIEQKSRNVRHLVSI